MIVLGLTGSIGMGKSTTAQLFAQAGVLVYDADAAVHALYAKGGAAVSGIAALFPEAVTDGAVDRAALSQRVRSDPTALKQLEAVVHPLLAAERKNLLAEAEAQGVPVTVMDIPLLFETGGEKTVDAVVVVSAPAEIQAARVLARPEMDPEKFALLLSRQMPDAEKRARADFVIDTGDGLESARRQVEQVMTALADPAWTSRRTKP
jgi:dephospho-CoA kinase